MRFAITFPLLMTLLHCGPDETLSGYGAADVTWKLIEINGTAFAAEASVQFPEEGKINGTGPCNTFFGTQSEPYPWFNAEKIAGTRRACPELEAEALLLKSLEKMTLAEIAGMTLILSNGDGGQMVFKAAP